MKRISMALLILAAGAGSALAAGSPFAGTWKLNVAKSKFTGDTFTYSKTATGFHFSDGGPRAYNFAVDGKDYPTVADRTTAWTSAGKNAWDVVTKAHGTVLTKTHRTLSADGKTLTASYTEYRQDGTIVHESDVYTRVSGGPGLAGKWRDVKVQAASDTMTVATPSPGRFEIDFPSDKVTLAGKTDGSATPATGPTAPPGAVSHYTAAAPNRWEFDGALNGKTFFKGVMTVSADGKTLTRTTWVPGKETEKTVEVYDRA